MEIHEVNKCRKKKMVESGRSERLKVHRSLISKYIYIHCISIHTCYKLMKNMQKGRLEHLRSSTKTADFSYITVKHTESTVHC